MRRSSKPGKLPARVVRRQPQEPFVIDREWTLLGTRRGVLAAIDAFFGNAKTATVTIAGTRGAEFKGSPFQGTRYLYIGLSSRATEGRGRRPEGKT